MQSEGVHVLSGEPSRSIRFENTIRVEWAVNVSHENVELPPSPAVLNVRSSYSIRWSCTNFFLDFSSSRIFGRLPISDGASRNTPRPPFIDGPRSQLQQICWLPVFGYPTEKKPSAASGSPMNMACVANRPTFHEPFPLPALRTLAKYYWLRINGQYRLTFGWSQPDN
jgi:hypothetical protein